VAQHAAAIARYRQLSQHRLDIFENGRTVTAANHA